MTKKLRQKLKYLENEKRNKKHFSSFLKGLHLPKIVSDLRVCLEEFCNILNWKEMLSGLGRGGLASALEIQPSLFLFKKMDLLHEQTSC